MHSLFVNLKKKKKIFENILFKKCIKIEKNLDFNWFLVFIGKEKDWGFNKNKGKKSISINNIEFVSCEVNFC